MKLMRSLAAVLALVSSLVLAQSTGINGGGPNGYNAVSWIGTLIPGDCAKWLTVTGTAGDAGAPCGSGGGGSPGGATDSAQYNAGGGTFGGVLLAADQALMGTAGAPQATSVPDCEATNDALNYSTTTHGYSCQTVSGGSGGGGGSTFFVASVPSVETISSGVPSGDPNLKWTNLPSGNYGLVCQIHTSPSGTGTLKGYVSETGTTANGMWNYLTTDSTGPGVQAQSGTGLGSTTALVLSATGTAWSSVLMTADVAFTAPNNTVQIFWALNGSGSTTVEIGSWCELLSTTSAGSGGSGNTSVASVPSNETYSNTVVANDPNLTFTGLVNGIYGWHCYITYTVGAPQNGIVGVTAGGTFTATSYSVLPLQSGSAPMAAPNFGTTSTLAGTSTNSAFELDGRVLFTSASGNSVTLQFATSLAASPLTIGAASFCTMNKVG